MWLLFLVFGLGFVSSAQVNHTIDDASPLVTYRAVIDRRLTGFNSSRLNNGTVTFIPATAHDSPTISMNFTGTAIYVFVAYPAGHNKSLASGFSARIDGVPYGGWAVAQTGPLVNHLAYHNNTMPNGPHNFVIQVQPKWELYFDYAMYTSGDPDLLPSSNSAPPTNISSVSLASNTGISVPIATGDVAGGPRLTPSVSISTVNVPASTSPGHGGVAGVTFTGNTPAPTGSDNIPVQASTGHKRMPVATIVGGVLGAVILLALVSTPLVLRRRALARGTNARNTPRPFIVWKPDGDDHTDGERDGHLRGPPLTPLVLHPPPPARTADLREKTLLSVTIPTWTAISEAPTRTSGTEAPQTSLSAASNVTLAQIAEQVRRMRMSMLRLETGMPEARDGGPALIRPPAYGSENRQSQVYSVNEQGHGNRE